MKLVLFLAITLIAVGATYYFAQDHINLQENVQVQQNAAQQATDAYRANQQKMMEQMEQ